MVAARPLRVLSLAIICDPFLRLRRAVGAGNLITEHLQVRLPQLYHWAKLEATDIRSSSSQGSCTSGISCENASRSPPHDSLLMPDNFTKPPNKLQIKQPYQSLTRCLACFMGSKHFIRACKPSHLVTRSQQVGYYADDAGPPLKYISDISQ